MSDFGLTGLRDSDGNVRAQTKTFEWQGEEVKLKYYPLTLSEQERLEEDEEIDADWIRDFADSKIVKPQIPDDEEWTFREIACFIECLLRDSTGDVDAEDIASQVAEELEEREQTASAGN